MRHPYLNLVNWSFSVSSITEFRADFLHIAQGSDRDSAVDLLCEDLTATQSGVCHEVALLTNACCMISRSLCSVDARFKWLRRLFVHDIRLGDLYRYWQIF